MDIIGPHDDGIFAIVRIVVFADGGFIKAKFHIELPGDTVGLSHFEGRAGGPPSNALFEQGEQQAFSDMVTSMQWIDRECRDVGFVHNHPGPAEPDDLSLVPGHEVAGRSVGKLGGEGSRHPGDRKTQAVDAENRLHILGTHGLDRDRIVTIGQGISHLHTGAFQSV